MDMDSPDKNIEEIKKEDGAPVLEKPDVNLIMNKDEQMGESLRYESEVLNNGMQVYSNQEYPGSPILPAGVDNEGLQSPVMKSNSVDSSSPVKRSEEAWLPNQSDLDCNDVERRISDYNTEGRRSPMEDYQSHNKKEGDEGSDHVDLPGGFLDGNANITFSNEVQTEDSYSCFRDPLSAVDNNICDEIMGTEAFNYQSANSPTFCETVNGNFKNASAANSHSEKAEVNEEMDGGNLSHHTEMKEDDYSSVIVASENGEMVWENSGLHSPQRTQNNSPSPERQLSVSAERSPHTRPSPDTNPSPRQEERPSPANSDKKPASSPRSSRRKYSPSSEKHSMGRKRASSRDRASPFVRQKSPSGRTTHRDSHHRDNSPRRRLSASPQRRDSQRRRGRSTSRSPVRRRDSPGHKRDRSRSPYARDRNRRSPRRRHSPRHRSPPGSRRRSPRRPWSPPANRSTGVGRPGNNLFVAGFSYVTTERDLEKKFSRFGRVKDVRIVRDRRSGESRGFGFLSLERDEDADAAIRALDQTQWNGRVVLVEKSKTSSR